MSGKKTYPLPLDVEEDLGPPRLDRVERVPLGSAVLGRRAAGGAVQALGRAPARREAVVEAVQRGRKILGAQRRRGSEEEQRGHASQGRPGPGAKIGLPSWDLRHGPMVMAERDPPNQTKGGDGLVDLPLGQPKFSGMPQRRTHLIAVGLAVAAAFLAFGFRLTMVRAYGTDVPLMDEWDALGGAIFVPRSLGLLHAANFLAAQNEHRIVLSRLIGYSLAVANGQWDPLLEMTVNAAIHAGLCAALLIFARRFLRGIRFAAVALLTVPLFAGSFDWENTLQGIQSQFYLLEWGAFGMFLLCAPAEPLSRRWCLGLLVGVLSLGTMSTGFFAAAALLVLMAVRAGLERRIRGRDAAAAALLAALCAFGFAAVVHVPGHEILRSRSAAQWAGAAATALSWPQPDWPLAFIILQLPMAALIVRCVRGRRLGRDESVLVCLALWTWLQVAAIAYGRANFGMVRSSRYADLYAVGCFANLLALALQCGAGSRTRAQGAWAAGWMVLFACGLWARDREAHLLYLDRLPALHEIQGRKVRSFLATGDLAGLSAAGTGELPYPRADVLGSLLSAPGIRELLPVGIRPAVPLQPDPGSVGFEVAAASTLPAGPPVRIWIARRGPAHFVSQPLPGNLLPFVHIGVSGSAGLGASPLRIETEDGRSRPFPGGSLGDGRWHAADIELPEGPGPRIVAEMPAGDHWLAFSEPVEVGRESRINSWLLRRSGAVEAAALAFFLASWLALLALDLRRPEPPGPGT